MPLKPVKRDIKVWVLADNHNGISFKCTPSTARRGLSKTSQHLKGKYYHVFFDKCFTSEELLQHLAEEDIYAYGTAWKYHRCLPSALKMAKLKICL